jgi:hypothetical protein
MEHFMKILDSKLVLLRGRFVGVYDFEFWIWKNLFALLVDKQKDIQQMLVLLN